MIALLATYYFMFFILSSHRKEMFSQNQTVCSQIEEKVIAKNYPNIILGVDSVISNSYYSSSLKNVLLISELPTKTNPVIAQFL
jgi:hypothetical protein